MSVYDCLYEHHDKGSNYCLALHNKECENCSFYRGYTYSNWIKYRVNVEDDILKYRTSKSAVTKNFLGGFLVTPSESPILGKNYTNRGLK